MSLLPALFATLRPQGLPDAQEVDARGVTILTTTRYFTVRSVAVVTRPAHGSLARLWEAHHDYRRHDVTGFVVGVDSKNDETLFFVFLV